MLECVGTPIVSCPDYFLLSGCKKKKQSGNETSTPSSLFSYRYHCSDAEEKDIHE